MKSLNRGVPALVVAVAITVLGIPAGPAAFAVPAPTCQVWVTSRTSNHPTLIDGVTSQTSTLDIGDTSWKVAMTPDGSKAYVATDTSGIKVIDIAGNYQLSTINRASFVVATSLDGTKMYTTDWSPGVVHEYDTATDTATGRSANTDINPTHMTVSPDGAFIYVANYNSNPATVTKIDTSTFTATNHQVDPAPPQPAGLVVSPDGSKLYVVLYAVGQVKEIDTATMSVQRTVSTSAQPRDVAVNSAGSKIYVNSVLGNSVEVIDTTTFQITAVIPVGNVPQKLAISPDDRFLFVANQGSDTVSKIDLSTNTVVETIAVNSQPYGIAIGPLHCTTVAPQVAVPAVPIWRVSMDPAGGVCTEGSSSHDDEWTSVFVGYRYLPGASDCERDGYSFTGWADAAEPEVPLTLPLLVDPSDGEKRWFVASNLSLLAVWKLDEVELDDLTGTSPGEFVGGPDRATAEGGGVVDGYYIPPGTQFGPWMLATPR